MKKRILCLVLAIAMLLGVMLCTSSCFVNNLKINRAIKKTNKLTDIDADMTISITIGKNTQKTVTHIKVDGENEDEPLEEMTMKINGSSQVMYADGDYVYVSNGNGSGYKVDKDDFGTSSADDMENLLTELPREAFDDAEYKKGKKGKLTLTTELDGDVFEDVFESFTKGIEEGFVESVEASNFSYDDCEISITIQKGYIIELDIQFEIDMEVNGSDFEAFVHVNLDINDPGEDVKVKLPKGCKSWEESEY